MAQGSGSSIQTRDSKILSGLGSHVSFSLFSFFWAGWYATSSGSVTPVRQHEQVQVFGDLCDGRASAEWMYCMLILLRQCHNNHDILLTPMRLIRDRMGQMITGQTVISLMLIFFFLNGSSESSLPRKGNAGTPFPCSQ